MKQKMPLIDNNVTEKTWDDFWATGLLFLINQILHAFGWSIVLDIDGNTNTVKRAYPARVKYRGFTGKVTKSSYKLIAKYMKNNAKQLSDEIED